VRELATLTRPNYALCIMGSTVLASNIAALRRSLGLNQASFAERVGTAQSYVSKWERGMQPNTRALAKMAEMARCSVEAFMDDAWKAPVKAEPRPVADLPPSRSADAGETVEIMAVDLSYAMGEGRSIDDYVEEEPFRFDLGFVRSISRSPPHRLRLARGLGDSMLPTLQTYDRVMVDTTQNRLQLDDRVYAISREGAGSIKRLRRAGPKRILVKSDNPAVDDYEVDEVELIIHGRVIWFARDL
jgi:phage repressor protein C with HTH and peptisase S24 domain